MAASVSTRFAVVAALAACIVPSVAAAAEPYCEDNPAVIYCNDFESGGLSGLSAGPAASVVTSDTGAPVFDGDYALLAEFTPPYNAEAEFGIRFDGVDQVYMRFYVRFDGTWDEPMHHWYAIHGDHPDDEWACHGDAGCRPNGQACLSGSTVDTRVAQEGQLPGEPFFYTYHPEMNCDPGDSCANYADPQAICDGCAAKGLPCDNGLECCWGNWFEENQGVATSMVQDTWYEIETMVAANTPGAADGSMALWIDGVLVAQHEGIRWRDTDVLRLNHVIFWNYYPAVQSARRVWFDNLVVSTEPIGSGGPGGNDDGAEDGDDGPGDGADDGPGDGADDGPGDGPGGPDDGADGVDDGGAVDGAGADGTSGDGGQDGGTGGGADGGGDSDDAGCACATGPSQSRQPWALALLLLACAGPRRRRDQ
ncbi:MAG: hypothetical protein AAF721_28705 [Myxococcota bacterium]